MPVMQVGVVRVRMHHRLVPMRMHMRFAPVPGEVVLVAVVLVVRVRMRVLDRLMHVLVLVALAHVQPHARRHQGRRGPERGTRPLAEGERERRAEEGRDRKVCPGARGAQMAQRDYEKRKAHALAEKSNRGCGGDRGRRRQASAQRDRNG